MADQVVVLHASSIGTASQWMKEKRHFAEQDRVTRNMQCVACTRVYRFEILFTLLGLNPFAVESGIGC